jgi:hypothetical protein
MGIVQSNGLGNKAESTCEYIVAGHSHIFALGAEFSYSGPVALAPITLSNRLGFFLMEPWGAGRGKPYWDALVEYGRERAVVLMFHGNQHYANFLLSSEPPFDFVDASDMDEVSYHEAVLVPRSLIKASPKLVPGGLTENVGRLLSVGCPAVFVAGTPPVRDDYGDYVDELRKDTMWRGIGERLGVDISNCPFTPPRVMKKLWRVMQEIQEDLALAAGATYIPVPPDAVDPKGYLAAACRGPLWNFTHANEEYGRMMLRQIEGAIYS